HEENSSIPPEILSDLKKYFDPSSPNFHEASALSASTLSFLDTQMKTWFGSFIQPGTAKALFEFGKTGQLGSPSDQGSLTQIYANYGINIICNWGDTKMGLPAGTTKMIYDYFTKYQAALAQYNTARAAYEAGKATAAAADLKKAMNAEAAAATQIKAEFYTFVVTKVFAKQLRVMEEKLGLVPGSSDLLVSAAVQYLMSTGNPIITLAIFVAWNLFGVYRIDVICSACGYYPEMDNPLGLSCPLSDFDGKESGSFRQGTITAAQWKVKQVIGESLNMSKSLNDANMLPTQIMTLRQEDVDAYASQLNSDYGAANARGNSGLWSNKLMWDHIHIGF
ncbi:MAG: hypothetical protein HW405_446, partial [Candidatus Berkelbacteria bacterium]|nr:hypothetical protein [Candidatus Berkelbacteria bacterium]